MTTRTPLGALGAFPANVPIQDPSVGAVFTGLVGSLNSWTQRVATLINTVFNGQLPGTQTNDNATAGNVGEFVSVLVPSASAISITSLAAYDLASIVLTAGDWDVTGLITLVPSAGTTANYHQVCLNTTSVTLTDSAQMNTTGPNAAGSGNQMSGVASTRRFNLASTTTVYLVGLSSLSAGTPTACGYVRARRVR